MTTFSLCELALPTMLLLLLVEPAGEDIDLESEVTAEVEAATVLVEVTGSMGRAGNITLAGKLGLFGGVKGNLSMPGGGREVEVADEVNTRESGAEIEDNREKGMGVLLVDKVGVAVEGAELLLAAPKPPRPPLLLPEEDGNNKETLSSN